MSTSSANDLFLTARNAVAEQKYEKALSIYNKILEQSAQHWEPNFFIPYIKVMQNLSEPSFISNILYNGDVVLDFMPSTIRSIGQLTDLDEVVEAFSVFSESMLNLVDVIDQYAKEYEDLLADALDDDRIKEISAKTLEAYFTIACILSDWGAWMVDVFSLTFSDTVTACMEQSNNYYNKAKKYASNEEELQACNTGITNNNNLLMHLQKNTDNQQQQSEQSTPSSNNKQGGCYVATAVYGSYDCPEVWVLRRFRDNTLDNYFLGRIFIRLYYATSPTLVKWFGETQWFKKMLRLPLNKMIEWLQGNGVENTPYHDKY